MEATAEKTMIKASELRIGNAVRWESIKDEMTFTGSGFIYELHEEYCKVSLNRNRATLGYKFLRPIPLTREMLEKCGTIRETLSGIKYLFIKNLPEPLYFVLSGGDRICLSMRQDIFPEFVDLQARAFYLHQLQNLYFALTGEELQINL